MTVSEVMAELESFGNEGIKKIFLKHGNTEPMFGVKVEQLKTIQKKIKKNHELALGLYATGNSDAMYLAGLIAEDEKMSREQLQLWAQQAQSTNINCYMLPWVATGNPFGFDLGMEWLESKEEYVAVSGWSTLTNWVSQKPDSELDIDTFRSLIGRVEKEIHTAPNKVRQAMNLFIISVGVYVKELTAEAKAAAHRIGVVTVDMNGTACKVPEAVAYIDKCIEKGQHGKKKKTVKC